MLVGLTVVLWRIAAEQPVEEAVTGRGFRSSGSASIAAAGRARAVNLDVGMGNAGGFQISSRVLGVRHSFIKRNDGLTGHDDRAFLIR